MLCLVVALDDRRPDRLVRVLRSSGHAVDLAHGRAEALWRCRAEAVDVALVVVDTADGRERDLVAAMRGAGAALPVIVVAGRAGADDVVAVLDAGADDVVARPVRFREITARLRALTRRSTPPGGTVLRAGPVSLDVAAHRVDVDGVEASLTPRQFRLLGAFLRRPGLLLSREHLLEVGWDAGEERTSNVVDQAVAELRRRLGAAGAPPGLIETVRGVGYRWRP